MENKTKRDWSKYVGLEVTKVDGNKFDNGKFCNVVLEFTINPYTNNEGFKFKDGLVVDCDLCKPLYR